MLCAVIHKCALNVGHKRNGSKIAHENTHLHKALKDCGNACGHLRTEAEADKEIDACSNPYRKENEQQRRKSKTQDKRYNHNHVGKLCAKLIGEPLFKL